MTAVVSHPQGVNAADPDVAYPRWNEGQPNTAVHPIPRPLHLRSADGHPPPADQCTVDHDQLQPQVATVGGRRNGARISYWSCPSCPYYFTAITALPKKAPMQKPTLEDQHSIVAMFATCKTMTQVERALPHLRTAQIEAIRDDNGGNRLQELRFAEKRLRQQIEATGGQPAPIGHERLTVAPTGETATLAPKVSELIELGRKSKKASIRNLATKIDRLIGNLRSAVELERDEQRAAEKLARERATALADVEKAEAALQAAREKAGIYKASRRSTTTAGVGGTNSKTIRAWAKANKVECPGMGRVPARVVEAYNTAHPQAQAS